MTVQSRKKLEGESGVRDWFNRWFPHYRQGVGATIMTSGGTKDIGDIDGVPFTMVEVKNYANPPLGSLATNAEWKWHNSGRDLWLLVVKRKGFGTKRAGNWSAVTTVEGLEKLDLVDSSGRSVRDLVGAPGVHTLSVRSLHWANLWGAGAPDFSITLNVTTCYNGVLGTIRSECDGSVVLNVHPRRKSEVDGYFVTTTLDEYCRLLEAVGVLPPGRSVEHGED